MYQRFKMFVDDHTAVSPVVGVILMVAVTVILSAVIGAFVLDLGGQTKANPSAGVTFDENADGTVSVQAISMDNAEKLKIIVDGTPEDEITSVGQSVSVSAGNISVVGVLDGKEAVIQTHSSAVSSPALPEHDILVGSSEDADFATLNDAVASVGDDQTILVEAGSYATSATVASNNVTIRGMDGAVLTSEDFSTAVNVTGTDVTMTNLEFTGGEFASPVAVGNSSDPTMGANFTFTNNHIHNIGEAVTFETDGDVLVANNEFDAIYTDIRVLDGNVEIRNNTFHEKTSGELNIYESGGDSVVLRHNTLVGGIEVTTTVDAIENYWGATDESSITANISGDGTVTYDPWCMDGSCDTLSNE